MGHGGADKYSYAREVLDEQYVCKELGRLWNPSEPAKAEELIKLTGENQELREKMEALERCMDSLGLQVYAWAAKKIDTRNLSGR